MSNPWLLPGLRDVIQNVFFCILTPLELARLSQTCRHLYSIIENESSWRLRWVQQLLPYNHYLLEAAMREKGWTWRSGYAALHLAQRFLVCPFPLATQPTPLTLTPIAAFPNDALREFPSDITSRAKAVIFICNLPEGSYESWGARVQYADECLQTGAFLLDDNTFVCSYRFHSVYYFDQNPEQFRVTESCETTFKVTLRYSFRQWACNPESTSILQCRLIPDIAPSEWRHHLLTLILDEKCANACRLPIPIGQILKCIYNRRVTVTIGDVWEGRFVIKHPTPDALVTEINQRFEPEKRLYHPIGRDVLQDYWTLRDTDVITITPVENAWLRLLAAAEAGDPEKQLQAAISYEAAHKWQMALAWFVKSAEQGNRVAAYHAGLLYYSYPSDIKSDYAQAERWLQFAVDRKHASAPMALKRLRQLQEWDAKGKAK